MRVQMGMDKNKMRKCHFWLPVFKKQELQLWFELIDMLLSSSRQNMCYPCGDSTLSKKDYHNLLEQYSLL